MTETEKAYFRAADVVTRALRAAQEYPEAFSKSFEELNGPDREASMKALEHLSRLGIDAAIAETKRHITNG